ncbi:hypothetical protein Pst134EA_029044 [Puccinia striiformis f. sp. tritici]|uniref:hypothetical protein n=1 Tax=Puccinia striiformis f. sp. tritici TaxID=168172 RepID=UPI00200737FA|nr:hypothetical protein Pst134EA_029044 [Puccinia striiformis f. sp. tritici]KAH9447059.1 hypothetical protein Pst134EA_029044 [Puccinia striiformis f. sp. tritici]
MDETTMMTTTKTITSLLIWVKNQFPNPSNVDSPIGLSNHLVFSTFRSVSPIIWPTTELLIILRSVPLFYWPTTNKIPGRRNLSTTLGRQLQPVNTEEIPTMTHNNMDLTRSMVRLTVNRDGLMGLTAMLLVSHVFPLLQNSIHLFALVSVLMLLKVLACPAQQ